MSQFQQELPAKFIGKFKLGKSENFDEYLSAKGVNWLLRKLIGMTSVTKTFEASSSSSSSTLAGGPHVQQPQPSPPRYNMYNHSAKENTAYKGWALGEEFNAKGLDGKEHRITFYMVDDEGAGAGATTPTTLAERHVRVDNPTDEGEVYKYTVDEHDQLVLKLEMKMLHQSKIGKSSSSSSNDEQQQTLPPPSPITTAATSSSSNNTSPTSSSSSSIVCRRYFHRIE